MYIYKYIYIGLDFHDSHGSISTYFFLSCFTVGWLRHELSMLILQCVLGFVEKKTFVDSTGIVSYCFAEWMRGAYTRSLRVQAAPFGRCW